jgi:hypothetical protein
MSGSHDVSLTVVNVIQRLVRIIRIIDNQSSTQPITVLIPEVTVVPESPLEWWWRECIDILRGEKGTVLLAPGL